MCSMVNNYWLRVGHELLLLPKQGCCVAASPVGRVGRLATTRWVSCGVYRALSQQIEPLVASALIE
jgi:hypothetical protein